MLLMVARERWDEGMTMATESHDLPLRMEDILREEANALHEAAKVDDKSGTALYQELNRLGSAALCLSGGGIRSAAFALGVIQALAAHPRPTKRDEKPEKDNFAGDASPDLKKGDVHRHRRVENAEQSLLGKFHYLSTVSGGGYIGSWLSAGIARMGFDQVWRKLIYREPKPEDEAAQISWLRTYSNYLTPKLGLTSADTWSAVALSVRNLMLNWLVFAPVLCTLLMVIKLIAVGSFALRPIDGWGVGFLFAVAALLQILALRFALLHRPTWQPPQSTPGASVATKYAPLRDERKQGHGGDEGQFVRHDLLPSVVAAFGFTLAFLPDITDPILEWKLSWLAGSGFIIGALLYAISWLVAWPWPKCEAPRGRVYWLRDLWCWTIAGGVYGAIIGWGVYLFTLDLTPLIGGITVTDATKDTLLLLIYGVPWIILAQLTAEMIFVGLTNWQLDSDADREWFGRSTGWFAVSALAWLVIAFLALVGGDLAFELYAKAGSYFGKATGGLVSAIAGVGTAILGKSTATPARAGNGGGSLWKDVALAIGTTVFLVALVVGFSALLDNLLLDYSLLQSKLMGGPVPPIPGTEASATPVDSKRIDLLWLLLGFAVVAFVGVVASKYVNINRFSLHALYRNRLIRAFLGATNPDRRPNNFTGFDERDNPRMVELWKDDQTPKRLFHVINIALNIVSSKRLAWQERKAESFTVTPLHCGTACGVAEDNKPPAGAYRRTAEYGAKAGASPSQSGISVGTAMAISGAAASPNMGYHSSPLVTLLLALFNVRLGWWLGNPGKDGKDTYKTEGPKMALRPLRDELFGLTTDENPYVYLSDGGHFENLGLYEMVRRRCRFIVVSDAGCDKDFHFEDLGNAVRKIWLDLGVSITFKGLNALRFRAPEDSKDGSPEPPFYAIGTVHYPAADGGDSRPGIILYLKPCFHRNRINNVGVRNYAILKPEFPHETTADQFFSESQLESYRALGFEMMDSILIQAFNQSSLPVGAGIDEMFERFRTNL